MPRLIIINSTPQEARVATMENARLLEIQIERVRERSLAGSICKGRVLRVLPGMQAAFVDIGLEKAAFLPGADFFPMSADEYALRETPGDTGEAPEAAGDTAESGTGRRARVLPPIEERLSKGQDVIVQISKEPIGTKGARLTSNISLPGRYLVYLPHSNQIGISRRLASEEERQRLREAVEAVASESGGITQWASSRRKAPNACHRGGRSGESSISSLASSIFSSPSGGAPIRTPWPSVKAMTRLWFSASTIFDRL